MKYEDINENTIKITLSFDDLTDYDIKLSDFFGNQEVIEQFFYELVDELGLENRFGNVGMLTFQIQPFPQGVHMIVHEEAMLGEGGEIPDDPEEFEELMTGFYNKLNEIGADMARERGITDFKPGLGLYPDKPGEGEDVDKPGEGEGVDKPGEGEGVDKPSEGEGVDKPVEGGDETPGTDENGSGTDAAEETVEKALG